MSISAKVSSTELSGVVSGRYANSYFEARLIDSAGTIYNPANTEAEDTTFLASEIPVGTGGYSRQIIGYLPGDVGAYTDDGIPLSQRAVVFEQDGSGTAIQFTHLALVWSEGNVVSTTTPGQAPTSAVPGTYTALPSTTDGSGVDAIFDLEVTNTGGSPSDYTLTVRSAGYGYQDGDTVTIGEAVLVAAGAVSPGAGSIAFTLTSSELSDGTNAGKILSVAQTTNRVTVTAGNQAAFYINLKLFGFYSV